VLHGPPTVNQHRYHYKGRHAEHHLWQSVGGRRLSTPSRISWHHADLQCLGCQAGLMVVGSVYIPRRRDILRSAANQ
jgi:hypothetical protein